MNRSEFLNQLRAALENDLSESAVQENINYYNHYITDEVESGKSEQEVLEMLGDPWVLARNIIDAPSGSQYRNGYTYETEGTGREQKTRQEGRPTYHHFGMDSWWKKLLLVLLIVGIVLVILTIVGGFIRFILPIVIPVMIVVFIVRLLSR